MARIDKPSSIDRLPEEIRAEVGRLRVQGRTIDEILAHLKSLDVEVSRSALGRHVKGLAALRERMHQSREMATALVSQFGDQPDNKIQRLNLELMHGIILQALTATDEDEDGEIKPVTFNPQEAKYLAESLAKLASAEKTDADRTMRVRAELAKDASKKLETAVTAGDLEREAMIRAKRIMGFD